MPKQSSPGQSPQHLSQVMPFTENCGNAHEDGRGFPSPQQFEDILNDYIASLSPKKRDKALIGQKRYDNILAVLKDPRCTTIESAQFRFWAKKMFRLGPDGPESNLVHHEGKPVAVRESLYRILVDAHSRANHGGRDKTSTEVRKNFAWIPKELIARFVRYCPGCATRRNNPAVDYSHESAGSPMETSSGVQQQHYSSSADSLNEGSNYTTSPGPHQSVISPLMNHHQGDNLVSQMHDNVNMAPSGMSPMYTFAQNGYQMSVNSGKYLPSSN